MRVYNKKLKNKNLEQFAKFCKKKNCLQPVRFCWPFAAGPTGTPPSIVGIASGQPADRPAVPGHGAACCKLAPHAPGQKVRMPLGHLGHLGHRFKLQAGASGWLALGHLGHCFLRDPNDIKAWRQRARWSKSFGSFGSFCHATKIGGRRRVSVALQSYRY